MCIYIYIYIYMYIYIYIYILIIKIYIIDICNRSLSIMACRFVRQTITSKSL